MSTSSGKETLSNAITPPKKYPVKEDFYLMIQTYTFSSKEASSNTMIPPEEYPVKEEFYLMILLSTSSVKKALSNEMIPPKKININTHETMTISDDKHESQIDNMLDRVPCQNLPTEVVNQYNLYQLRWSYTLSIEVVNRSKLALPIEVELHPIN
ncbi:hypothetical protein DEO72_LG7g406 [Vigna unguiculata]|uniref:Uncharacterized protein n=1 Tax=Vigna unguiculata TaxID=3917 RepID=A0A4D6MGJ7_VIGUN|nr:hypothetical protein DEO72_LG7g406 [Vigna unguiculata]